jgi:hypothetical protein
MVSASLTDAQTSMTDRKQFWSVYAPMDWMYTSSPQPIRRAFRWYQDLWTPADWAMLEML